MASRLLVAALCLALHACSGFPVLVRSEPVPSVETPDDRRAAFAAAYKQFRQKPTPATLATFQALLHSYPELADYHLFFAGATSRALGDSAGAEALLRRLRREYPNSTRSAAAALELGLALVDLGRNDEALPLLQIAANAKHDDTAQPARFSLAEQAELQGDFQAAHAGFLDVRRHAPGSALSKKAKKRLQALRAQYSVLDPVGRALVEEARLNLGERDYRAAKTALEQLLTTPASLRPGVQEAELLRLLADTLYASGDVDRAVALLRNLSERYPDSSVGSAAVHRRATILWNRDRDDEALAVFEAFLDRYPRNDQAAEAAYAVGRIHQNQDRSDEAIAAYSRLLHSYPRSSLANEARWRIGWVHYRKHRFDAAAASFAALASLTKDRARDEAAYWQARSLAHAGKAAAARDLYQGILRRDPSGYYAMWAEHQLGRRRADKVMLDSSAPAASEPPLPPPPNVSDPFHLDRALELGLARVFDLAAEELDALEEAYPGNGEVDRFVFAAYQVVDGYAHVLRRLRSGSKATGLSADEREHLLYPLAFWHLVQPRAEEQGLDPLLLEALMRQESLFDPRARSHANARGVMQLLPSTAKQVAGDPDSDPDLYDPETNIDLGSRYLRSLLVRFDFDPFKAIAAYNGGEAAVEKWQRRYGDLDPDELVESITYRETRDYVKKVVANYRKYTTLYPR